MYLDYLYVIIVLPFVILALVAQFRVNSVFNRCSQIYTRAGMSGADVARMVLESNGIYNVGVQMVPGNLTDHYDPRDNVIRLSEKVYSSTSAAAVGVAAHEAGHAVQHAEGYFPVKVRSAIIPVTNFCSRWSVWLIIIGMIFIAFSEVGTVIMLVGIAFFAMSAVFQLVTLPVEFNASRRAVVTISGCGRFSDEEVKEAKKVLRAAAMTYVAALAVSLATLLRYLIIFASVSGRKRK